MGRNSVTPWPRPSSGWGSCSRPIGPPQTGQPSCGSGMTGCSGPFWTSRRAFWPPDWSRIRPVRCAALCSTPGCYYVHNGRILQLSTGRILIPANWVPSSCYGKDIETSDLSGAFYSDDNGATWQESNWIAAETPGDHLAESIAVELKDGTVKCFMRSTSGYMRQAISKDGGVTWEKEYATQLRMPCSPFAVEKDPYTGNYYAAWINSFPAPVYQYPRCPLALAVSTDETETWQILQELENDPACSYGYPVIEFSPDRIFLLYYVNPDGRGYHASSHRLNKKNWRDKKLDLADFGYNEKEY